MKKTWLLFILCVGPKLAATDRCVPVVSPQELCGNEPKALSACKADQLLTALKEGNLIEFECLLSMPGVDVEYDYGNGGTLLIQACLLPIHGDNNKDFIKLLVDRGVQLHLDHAVWKTELGLGLAVVSGALPLLKGLFDQNPKLKDFYFGTLGKERSFYDIAIVFDAPLSVLQFLLDRGVLLALGRPPHHAIQHNNIAAAQFLLEKGTQENHINIDKMSCHKVRRSPLHYAVKYQNKAMVALILQHRPNLDQQDSKEYTPYDLAVKLGFDDIAQLLIESRLVHQDEVSAASRAARAFKATALKVGSFFSRFLHK